MEADLKKGEGLSLPLTLLVMVLIFGGFAAAGVPLAGAIASIAGGLISLLLFTYVIDLDITVVNVVTVLGLGLCIDYSLLMVSRYREQMHDLHDLSVPGAHREVPREVRERAMAITMATAGRTVIFSGVTVAIAVAGLLFIDMTIIQSVGAGAVSVVVIAVVVATTFVPALLVLSTKHVAGAGMLVADAGIPAVRRARSTTPRPTTAGSRGGPRRSSGTRGWPSSSVTALLVLLSIPAWRMNLVSSGVELLPPDNPHPHGVRADPDGLPGAGRPRDHGGGRRRGRRGADRAVRRRWPRCPTSSGSARSRRPGEIAQLPVFTADDAATDVVNEIRDVRPDEPQTWVTGQAAILVDFTEQLRHDVPIALLFVVLATLVLLFLLTGSVLIPIKALLMNLLSLGATFGILVLIFQDGRFESILGFSSTGGIEATLPVIIFAFAFGLSMDYEVFLLSRIKEFHDQGYDNDDSVRLGLQRTGRIITSAALLIVIVFAGFALGDLLAIKENGIALATAVLIDATLVRIILVPATMTLLGEWNWWAPEPLRAPARQAGPVALSHRHTRARRSPRHADRSHRRKREGRRVGRARPARSRARRPEHRHPTGWRRCPGSPSSADLTDLGQAQDALAGVDAVVHFAAIPAPGLRPEGETFRINALSTFNVFHAAVAHRLRRVVWASSETVLGLPFDVPPAFAPIDETIEPRPESSYALSKLTGETMAAQFARRSGIGFVALRISNIMEPDDYAGFPAFWDDAQLRRWNLWGYVDARDVAQAATAGARGRRSRAPRRASSPPPTR